MEKKSFGKSCVLFLNISSPGKQASSRNQAEELFTIFIFQELIKKVKFSALASISKGLQSQFLIDFFF